MKPRDIRIPIDLLRKLFRYDPEEGLLFRGSRRAGYIDKSSGYMRVYVRGYGHPLLHRVAWALYTGKWPEDRVDHRDGNLANNRFANFRPATMPEQQQNKALYHNSKSGFPGVIWHVRLKRWQAHIQVDHKKRHLGYYDTKEEAYAAYLTAKAELHTFQPTPR